MVIIYFSFPHFQMSGPMCEYVPLSNMFIFATGISFIKNVTIRKMYFYEVILILTFLNSCLFSLSSVLFQFHYASEHLYNQVFNILPLAQEIDPIITLSLIHI